jgi:hypothetical protein
MMDVHSMMSGGVAWCLEIEISLDYAIRRWQLLAKICPSTIDSVILRAEFLLMSSDAAPSLCICIASIAYMDLKTKL